MRKLTKAEEQIMMVLWELEQAFVKDLLAKMQKPKPHYNTISTLLRILVDKGIVGYTELGNSFQYYPILSKEAYSKTSAKNMLKHYFDNSASSLVSFFVKEKDLSISDLEEIIEALKNK